MNECHNRGIAVILDIVPNHGFGTDPLARLYLMEMEASRPTTHGSMKRHATLSVQGYDHGDPWTKEFWKLSSTFGWTNSAWTATVSTSAGLTQTNSGSNGVLAQYDQSRVDILFDYGNHIWNNHPGSYVI